MIKMGTTFMAMIVRVMIEMATTFMAMTVKVMVEMATTAVDGTGEDIPDLKMRLYEW